MKEKILIVEDEKTLREILTEFFEEKGFEVEGCETLKDALNAKNADVIILDVRLPDGNGIEAVPEIKRRFDPAEVIIITAYEREAKTAVKALKLGAFDYITKPFKLEDLLIFVNKALEKTRLKKNYEELKKRTKEIQLGDIIGISESMQEIFEKMKRVAKTNITVLITGESGTGKELVAQTIHRLSERSGKFVAVNCAAIPKELLESELFGYEKGAFTGATASKKGLIEEAHKGTLFLDEIGDMPLELQGKLLRFLEDHKVRRIGARQEKEVDVRIICATNKNLPELVEKGEFRKDLYFRISGFSIDIPPLKKRKEDIPILISHILKEIEKETKTRYQISSGALKALLIYDYPGNVRELKNILKQASLMSDGIIMYEHLPDYIKRAAPVIKETSFDKNLEELVADYEKELILQALEKAKGVKKKAAEILGISFRSLRYKLEKYGIK